MAVAADDGLTEESIEPSKLIGTIFEIYESSASLCLKLKSIFNVQVLFFISNPASCAPFANF